MSAEARVLRVCQGEATAPRVDHGIEVEFEALPAEWGDGHEVDVLLPDGSRVALYAEPEAGPAAFAWRRGPSETWLIRLEPTRPNVLVVHFEEDHRDIIALGL